LQLLFENTDAIYDDVAKEISKSNQFLHYKIPCKIPHRIFARRHRPCLC